MNQFSHRLTQISDEHRVRQTKVSRPLSKIQHYRLIAGIVLVLCVTHSFAVLKIWEQTFTDGTGESKYLISRYPTSGSEADEIAARLGCYLTKLETASENSFVSQIGLAQPGDYEMKNPWIGLRRVGPGVRHPGSGQEPFSLDHWRWTAGGTLAFDGFAPDEPNNNGDEDEGPESHVAINEHGPGLWNDLQPRIRQRSFVVEFKLTEGFRILSPQFVARTGSRYVGLRGVSQSSSLRLAVLDNELRILRTIPVAVNPDGTWEQVVRVGSEGRFLFAQDDSDPDIGDIIEVLPTVGLGPSQADNFEKLKKADAIFCAGGSRAQWILMGANYSHVALFTGSDGEGRPMIAEAIVNENIDFWQVMNQPALSLGSCQVVPLHESTLVRHPYSVIDVGYIPGLSPDQVNTVADAATSLGGRPYWTVQDFTVMRGLYSMWNPVESRPYPRFERKFWAALNAQSSLSRNGPRIICSTLVWQAYLSIGMDVSTNAAVIVGGLYGLWDFSYRSLLSSSRAFVHPDSLAQSGALRFR